MKRTFIMLAVSSSLLAAISGAVAQHTVVTDQELMDKLRDAAPAAVLKGAAILNMGADGQMKVIQAGTNGWTCMDPGGAPMCADESAMEWAKALRRVFEASAATSWPAAPVDRIENFPLMLRAALQKAAKRRDLFQQKIILRSASALVAGRFECVRHDIEG